MAEHPRTQLPEDPAYWDRLTRRIRDDARGPLAAYAGVRPTAPGEHWYDLIDRTAPWIAAASAAAMLLVWLALPGDDSADVGRWLERSVTPDEPAVALVSRAEPPNLEVLLAQFPPHEAVPPNRAPEDER